MYIFFVQKKIKNLTLKSYVYNLLELLSFGHVKDDRQGDVSVSHLGQAGVKL